jgi:hypothetical protein
MNQESSGRDKANANDVSCEETAQSLRQVRTGIVLSGRVVNGRVELDQSTLDEISEKFADAEISFVAVNAPFDPQSHAVVG